MAGWCRPLVLLLERRPPDLHPLPTELVPHPFTHPPCLQANRGMEVEMLEQQLDRARKDNTALRQRLEAAMATLASLASPSKPLLQKLAQVGVIGVLVWEWVGR